MHCSLIMHGFHNGKLLILCSNSFERCPSQSYSSSLTAFWIMEIIVLLSLSVRPFDIRWYGKVRDLEHSHVLYFPNMENAVHCSLIMHGFHNWKLLILCSNSFERCPSQSYSSSLTAFWIMEIIVLLSLSVRPFDIRWYGKVRDLEHSHVLYFPNMENAVHCSLIMHGFHNWKLLILCSNSFERCPSQSYSSSLTAFWIMEIIVLLSLSVRPFDIRWYGTVRVFTISTISQIALNVLLANNNLIFICWYMITSLPCLAHCNFDL